MRILDENGNVITDVDYDKGYLKPDTIVTHHDAVEGSAGKSHIEVLHEYPNGGKDVITVWDEEPIKAKEAYDETENIERYVLYTDDELKEREVQKKADEEAQRQAELIPTNEDLSEATIDLATGVSDNEAALAELGEYITSLEQRIADLEAKNNG